MSANGTAAQSRLRYAIYARYSSEMQTDLSIEAQVDRCQKAIANRGGVVIEIFKDEAISGWSLERGGFQALQTAASLGKFDAVMFWKFDRLARNHDHVVMIKMLLRKQYDVKLHCVEGYSEDDDDSAYSAMMEQMLAVFSAFYSRNLSSETKRGKQQRAINGEYNGSKPPLGYDLVTAKDATEARPSGLYVNSRQAALVRRAFKLYATGKYSDSDVATWLNERRTIQVLREGKQPINKEMVRDMLQNRLYTGRVGHTDTVYRGSLGEKRTTKRGRAEWFEGKHAQIVSDDLFDKCREARAASRRQNKTAGKVTSYVLGDRVYCARCAERKPSGLVDAGYGRMRPSRARGEKSYYRCLAHERGYDRCAQEFVRVAAIDAQLLSMLSNLELPDDITDRIERAVQLRSENESNLRRIEEIKEAVHRLDVKWENGFIGEAEYLEGRNQLQREIAAMRPVDYDELNEAADLLRNFRSYWDACGELDNPAEARKELVRSMVDRVYVEGSQIVTIVMHHDYAVLLGENETAHANIASAVQKRLKERIITTNLSNQSGDDGVRTRDLCLDRAVC